MWKFFVSVFFVGYVVSAEKVIIIGAGAAGIAAASRLLDNNITDFRILEAENRIGGRIHSFHFGNAFVDLGAQYIHGQKDNLAYALAQDYIKPGREIDSFHIYYSGRKKTGDNLFETFITLKDEAWEYGKRNVSLGDYFLERYNTTVFTKYKNDPEMINYAKNLLRAAESMMLSLEGSFSWFKTTTISNFVECEGDQTQSWNGLGYKTVLDMLLKNFPNKTGYNIDDKISLDKTVETITLNGTSIDVEGADGSKYVADHVIFTPSLGVLKHDHEKIFGSQLSNDKKDVIENLGFDGVMKVIFKFPDSWWGNEEHFIFVWNEEEKKNVIKEVPYGPVKDGDHWLSWFYTIGVAPNNQNVLIGWIVGPMVPDIEKLTEEEMKNGTFYALKKFLGKTFNVTEPETVIHSKWFTNPHFRGAYSYETVQLQQKNIRTAQKTLSEPIVDKDGVPRILFAGEATNPTRYSTVDGAIGSGYREGDRLVEVLR